MKKTVGAVVACALLVVTGCGGVAELDPDETTTVELAKQTVASAKAEGKLNPEGEQRLTDLIALCREKPLTDTDGQSMRELLDSLAPQLKSVDPEFSKKMQRIATSGCD